MLNAQCFSLLQTPQTQSCYFTELPAQTPLVVDADLIDEEAPPVVRFEKQLIGAAASAAAHLLQPETLLLQLQLQPVAGRQRIVGEQQLTELRLVVMPAALSGSHRFICLPDPECRATTEMRPPAQTRPSSAVPSAGVRGAGGLGKDVVGQQNPRALSVAAHWLPWPHPGIDLCCLLGRGGMAWPGSALRSVHSPPLPLILAVASVLTWFRHAPPPRKGSFGTEAPEPFLNDPMICLRSPPRTPLPGSRQGATRPFGFHLRARQDVAFPLPLAALQWVAVSKSVVQCQRFGEQPGETPQPVGFPTAFTP
ncbi:uncharacterized protein Triagg1_9760 [Trichoderma aggressivum f. europaeum]|uniref:Uncharacterized protein n=1 Tax=Trichoderma aggressivum f. europaeum TaxID=173218 RepID=A0AAE1I8D8_9HYPO|nr:hypothetical protein Triagg1_9760 [Trichoderma aggressivum f. europaeum]